MWRSSKLWHTAVTAALAALIIGVLDCILAGCGVGTAIIALRLGGVCAGIGFLLYLPARRLYSTLNAPLQLATALLAVAPLAVFAGLHLSKTATFNRLLGYQYRIAVPIITLCMLYTLLFWWLTSRRLKQREAFVQVVSIALATLLFIAATYLKKLHYPLAVSSIFFCWLSFQRPLFKIVENWGLNTPRLLSLIFGSVGIAVAFLPVSLEDTFAASDQGIISRDVTYWGKAHTIDELVRRAPLPTELPTPVMTDNDLMLPHLPGTSVVLISVDALRPDHLGINGYKRNLSPNIDRFLKNAIRFKNAYCTAPTSSFSIPAIHAGMPMEERLKSGVSLPPFLASHFNELGYETIGLFPTKVFSVGPALTGALQKSKFGFSTSRLLEMDAEKDVNTALAYLRRKHDKPLFMWVHFFDPHLPYSCHNKPFGDTQADCYDAEIAYLDTHIQRFIDEIQNTLNHPIIVFTADHAEAFGEHGRYYHSTDLYDEQIKVPLAFVVPGVSAKTVTTPVSNSNIFDTVLSLVQPIDRSLANDLRPHMISDGPQRPIFSAIDQKRAIIFDTHKLMCEDWPNGACALFDLRRDPNESRNLAAKRIQKTMEMLGLLKTASREVLSRLQDDTPSAIIMGRLKRPGSETDLRALASDPRSEYAAEAAQLLAFLKSDALADTLDELEQSPKKEVAAWAAVGNGLLDRDFRRETLLPFLHKPTLLGHWSAIILGKSGEDRALQPLLGLLKNEEPYLRAQAALTLGELGNRRAVNGLISLLQVKQSRWAAIEALGELEDKRALHILTRLKKNEPDVSNLPRYKRAIERIENN